MLHRFIRFDVRGYLQDVKKYETKINSLDVNDFSPVESEIEKLCDDERFKDLQVEQDLQGLFYLFFNDCLQRLLIASKS